MITRRESFLLLGAIIMSGSGVFGANSSGGGFPDAFAGNQGAMLINALKSANFLSGVSGWQIQRNGNAQFNNLTLRGTFYGSDYIINSEGAFFYSGTPANGNLIVSIANVSGDDQFNNPYYAGVAVYNAANATVLYNGTVSFYSSATTAEPGSIGEANGADQLVMESGQAAGHDQASLTLSGGLPASWELQAISGGTYSGSAQQSGSGDLETTSGSDGNTYDTARLTQIPTGSLTVNQTTFTQNVLPLKNVSVRSYRISGRLLVHPNQAAGFVELEFNGTATITGIAITFRETAVSAPGGGSGGTTLGDIGTINALGQAFDGSAFGAADREIVFDGWVTFATAGTFGLYAACGTASTDTYLIREYGTLMEYEPITAT